MKRVVASLLVASTLAASGAAHADPTWHEGEPVPVGYHVESNKMSPLLVTGLLMFGVPYALSFATAVVSYKIEFLPLMVPVGGPFLQMAVTHVVHGPDDSASRAAVYTVLVIDGALQAVGLTLALFADTLPKAKLVKDGPEATLLPVGPNGTAGLSVAGTF